MKDAFPPDSDRQRGVIDASAVEAAETETEKAIVDAAV
jgi:hypothetical protein